MADEKRVTLEELTMTELEAEAFEADMVAGPEKPAPEVEAEAKEPADPNALPDWVEFPPGFKIPPGKVVTFLRFKAKWLENPSQGDRWCMTWPLSDADEKLASQRARGDALRGLSELTKQTIRLMDGKRADWTMTPGLDHAYDPNKFWNEIGGRCRNLIVNVYGKTHMLSREEQQDFFANCVFVRTLGG
jgi:hypothetical protein